MSEKVKIYIDGKEVMATAGEKLLWAALDNDIFIPHLCGIRENETPHASCRLCFVEVEGYTRPVTSCTEIVKENMVVSTRTPAVNRLVETAFAMLMSNHRLECKKCPANGTCQLQIIARKRGLKLKPKELPVLDKNLPLDDSSPLLMYDPNKCVLCGRCVWACRQLGAGTLGFAARGYQREVTTFNRQPLGQSSCNACGACAEACPVGSLSLKRPPADKLGEKAL